MVTSGLISDVPAWFSWMPVAGDVAYFVLGVVAVVIVLSAAGEVVAEIVAAKGTKDTTYGVH